jgi:hypothetical protein
MRMRIVRNDDDSGEGVGTSELEPRAETDGGTGNGSVVVTSLKGTYDTCEKGSCAAQ